MSAESLPVQLACRVLKVSQSGFYAWRTRAPSARTVRHTLLLERIQQIHLDARGTYGSRRVHAELTMGQGVQVGVEAVAMLMRRAGIQGISGRPRWRRAPNVPTAGDLVDRQFHRTERDRLWLTDITDDRSRGNPRGNPSKAAATSSPAGSSPPPATSARKLMRYIREHNKTAKPIKWRYTDVTRRIRAPHSGVTVH